MGNPKKSDIATAADASWEFLEDLWWRRGIKGAARKAALEAGVDRSDLEQELILWLSVRPKQTAGRPSQALLFKRALHLAGAVLRDRDRYDYLEDVSRE